MGVVYTWLEEAERALAAAGYELGVAGERPAGGDRVLGARGQRYARGDQRQDEHEQGRRARSTGHLVGRRSGRPRTFPAAAAAAAADIYTCGGSGPTGESVDRVDLAAPSRRRLFRPGGRRSIG